jgi:hypothetical protein
MSRLAIVCVLALALLAPASALAQVGGGQDPFGPLPAPQPTPAPTQEPADDPFDSSFGGATLYVIVGLVVLAFVVTGLYIRRDARRSLPRDRRPERGRLREQGPHKHERKAKAKARARTKAQRAARRRNR